MRCVPQAREYILLVRSFLKIHIKNLNGLLILTSMKQLKLKLKGYIDGRFAEDERE